MKLSYPNPSRSFDASSRRVCFWGYDSAIEISFFVEAESGFLQAFDAALNRIHEVADKVYARGGKRSYACILAAEDF